EERRDPAQNPDLGAGGGEEQIARPRCPRRDHGEHDEREGMLRCHDGGMVGRGPRGRLERSCAAPPADWMRSRALGDGVQVLQAWFGGRGFDRHRHDTYAIGITDSGVQAFDYRGVAETSLPGQVVVLHPDETHDGRAGTNDGFGYRIVYVAPARIQEAARAIRGGAAPVALLKEAAPVNGPVATATTGAFRLEPEPLATDTLVVALAEALLEADPSCAVGVRPPRVDPAAVARARHVLDAATDRVVHSRELEAAAGLTRFELARQFR